MSTLQVDAPKQQTRLKVVLLSLPARTQAVLEFFFTSTGRTSFAPVTQDQADAAIFDLDTLESRQHWLDFHARSGRPGIALSVQPQDVEGAVWVRKPVTPAALLAAAADIHAERWVKPAPAPAAATVEARSEPAEAAGTSSAAEQQMDPASASDLAESARHELDRALAQLPGTPAAMAESVVPAEPADSPAEIVVGVAVEAAPAAAAPIFPAEAVEAVEAVAPRVTERTPQSDPHPHRVQADPAQVPRSGAVAAATGSPVHAPLPSRQGTRVAAPTPSQSAPAASERAARAGGLGGLLRRFFGAPPAPEPRRGRADGVQSAPAAASSAPVTMPAEPPVAASAAAMSHALRTAEPVPSAVPAELPVAEVAAPVSAPEVPASASVVAAADVAPAIAAPVPAPAALPLEPVAMVVSERSTASADATPAEPVPEASAAAHSEVPAADAADALAGAVRQRLLGGAAAAAAANEPLLCGLREDVPPAALSEDPELRYDPDVHLVSALREAYLVGIKWQVPTQLECPAGRIVVDPTRNLLLCGFDASRLESIFTTHLGKRPKTRTLNRQEQADVQDRVPHAQGVRRLDELLWRAGMLTAQGRLPIESDPNRPVYLRHWPNLTRISAIPHAVRIAALWSARGASLIETATLLGISQRHVIAFYNGALALDLVTEDGSHIRRAQRKAGRNRGLLTRLLGWLHR